MRSNVLRSLVKPGSYINLFVLFVFAGIITYFDRPIGVVCYAVFALVMAFSKKHEATKRKLWKDYIENITTEFDGTLKHALIDHPLPLHMMDTRGEIVWYNRNFAEIFNQVTDVLHTNIEDLVPNIKAVDFIKKEIEEGEKPERTLQISHNGRIYKLMSTDIDPGYNDTIVVYWMDITNHENLKAMYRDDRPCVIHIMVDNYEDLLAGTSDDKRSSLSAQIDKIIRGWATKHNTLIRRYANNKYFAVLENKAYEQVESSKFALLDEIREVETETDFPVSLSLGVGIGGKNLIQSDQYAHAALDLAQGRGGDQAVVKKISRIEYYGGKLKAVEKRNKGKSKIMAHALRQLIDQTSRVVIMGHRDPDMDSFGAALGIHSLVASRGKEADVIIDSVNDSLELIYQNAKNSQQYNFITSEQAMDTFNKDMLLVIVDTHRPSYTECPGIVERADKIVIIDHHRKMEENIENPTLSYMEPYASSTCELVSEIIQYGGDKKGLSRLEADALLAGITVDTKNFCVKAGVRTFEVASWLRRMGADTVTVRQYFQSDMETFKLKSEIITRADMLMEGIMISTSPQKRPFMNLITAQSADEMLNIKGVKASFVLGENEKGLIIISARSLNDVNVQLIMEKMGGGGHLTQAGAQIVGTIEDVKKSLEDIIKDSFKEGGK